MQKTVKIISTIMIVLLFVSMATPIFATNILDSINADTGDTGNVVAIGNKIYGIIQVVGSFVAVIIIVVLGIKYMMGSAEEKAEYKKTMIPYVIGAIFIFAASNLAKMVANWAGAI